MIVSAVILTLNEERNIVACIRALKSWCDDIVVYDSFSSDRTVELADSENVRFFQRKFDDYASQRNAALRDVKYPGEWILMVDADERWEKELGEKIISVISDDNNKDVGIFHFQRKDIFMGRWLKHNIGAGTWTGRLFRICDIKIVREINEEYQCSGRKDFIPGVRFIHYPFNNGVNWWISRHNRYSDMEAERLIQERETPIKWSMAFAADPVSRRKFLKQLGYRIPCRPVWMFIVTYFLRMGFLDGIPGFRYCQLRSMYERMIDIKMQEIKYLSEHDQI